MPRLEYIRQRDTEDNRNGGDHFKIDNGFCADTAQLFRIADTGNADHQR